MKFLEILLILWSHKLFFNIYPSFLIQQEIYLTPQNILSKIKHVLTFAHYLFNAQKHRHKPLQYIKCIVR